MKSRDCPMLVGMVTWPGERQSGREEGEGPLSQEKSLSASSLLQTLCCRLQRIITGLRVAVEEKDPANKSLFCCCCFCLEQPHFFSYYHRQS